MDWLTLIASFISVMFGGGLISLLTIREQRKGLKLDNKEKEDNRWERLADQLSDQVESLNNQIASLNERLMSKDALIQEKDDIISDLREKLDSVRTRYAMCEILRCEDVSCQSRQPKLGTRNVNIEGIASNIN